jgi:hypothetical protein
MLKGRGVCVKRLLLVAMFCCVGWRAGHAQVAVYGQYSGGFLSAATAQSGLTTLVSPSFAAWGGTFGAYDNLYHVGPLKLGGDGRFFIESSRGSTVAGNQIRGTLFGARLALFSKAVPFSPYIQAEMGVASTNYGTQSTRSASFAYQINGGLDYTIVPHLDARFEYGNGQLGSTYAGTRQTMQQLGLGLVVRLK